ncbi:MAG: phosphoglycerate dehydrogenase [Sphingobacteriaceae bacterium]|nr:phosphoglycerate dehydrogenase [Sphingobacteriaceae bacterium]
MIDMPRNVFISTSSFGDFSDEPLKLLRSEGFEVTLNPHKRKLNDAEVIELLKDVEGVIAGTENYSEEVLAQLDNLRGISRVGVGVDNIDFNVTTRRNIKVVATKTDLSLSVAELALALMFDLSRKLTRHNNLIAAGKWSKNIGKLLTGKKLGVIGLGKIGKTLVQLTRGLNMSYIAYDEYEDREFAEAYGVTYVAIEELLKQAEIVSIHLKYDSKLMNYISADKLSLLQKDAILVNTSRGELIDEEALYEALKANNLAGAGLDVFKEEPYSGKLRELPNVVLTPHIGSFVKEIRSDMEMEAVKNFIELMKY